MKIKTIDHASGVFKNYEGVEQHFDVALVSYIPDSVFATIIDDDGVKSVDSKIVMGVGTAFCKPKTKSCPEGDEYSPELGKKIAIAHATNPNKAFTTITQSEMGFIDSAIRSAILVNITENIKEEPERYSYKYSLDKEKFEKIKKYDALFDSLSDKEKIVVDYLSTCSDDDISKINYLLENMD